MLAVSIAAAPSASPTSAASEPAPSAVIARARHRVSRPGRRSAAAAAAVAPGGHRAGAPPRATPRAGPGRRRRRRARPARGTRVRDGVLLGGRLLLGRLLLPPDPERQHEQAHPERELEPGGGRGRKEVA